MRKPAVTTKIPPDTLKLLRFITADTGEQQRDILARLVKQEADRLKSLGKLKP